MEAFQLRYFESVVRRGSLTAAALDCGVSQPSLSTQIKNLEDELGIRLLDRKARGVSPTKAGERLLLTARRLLADMDECKRDLRRRNFAGLPTLRLGAQPLLASTVLPRTLAGFLKGQDSYQVVVREIAHHEFDENLSSRAIDLGLCMMTGSLPSHLDARNLFILTYGIVCAADHPLTKLKRPRLRDLLPHRLALFNDQANLVDRISQLGSLEGKPARVIFSSNQALTVFEMVAAGLGVSVLPTILEGRVKQRHLVLLPLHDRNLDFPVMAVWERNRALPVGAEALLEFISRSHPASPA